MTLIYQTFAHGVPVLIGDMLVSGPAPDGGVSLELPSHPMGLTGAFPLDSERVPVALQTKLAIINDRIAVGVCGQLSGMVSLLDHMDKGFKGVKNFTFADVERYWNGYLSTPEGHHFASISGAIILVSASDKQGVLSTNAVNYSSNLFGEVCAIGSGSVDIANGLKVFDKYRYSLPTDDQEFNALSANIMLVSMFYEIESLNNSNLKSYWGGGYDVIYLAKDGGFRFLNEYTLHTASLVVNDPNAEITPRKLMKYQRVDAHSLICCIGWGSGEKPAVYCSLDVRASKEEEQAGEIILNSELHVMQVVLIQNGEIRQFSYLVGKHTQAEPGPFFIGSTTDGYMLIYYQEDISEYFVERLRESNRP